ncbi:non-structural maintenance of chromosomes element 1 homolog [Clavelina lepadiformis]|uniref:Non-structural maintenance of chromosomes element 1 homolog n=1 Tax=Clavelina lepadiformis TaxID=159417 RepID=A0ABP0H263_CLALP
MSSYKTAHIYFLQTIMSRGIISHTECARICEKFCELTGDDGNSTLQDFIGTINTQLLSFHFKVRESKREDTGETVFVLVSMVENVLNRLVINGNYSRVEMDFFRKILDLIVLSSDTDNPGCASSIDILNIADSLTPKLSKSDAKKLLSRLVNDQWFYDNNGMIVMSPRSILELEHYLSVAHEGCVKSCKLCNLLVFYGQSCEHCNACIHNFCAAQGFKNTTEPKCFSCGHAWPNKYKPISGALISGKEHR